MAEKSTQESQSARPASGGSTSAGSSAAGSATSSTPSGSPSGGSAGAQSQRNQSTQSGAQQERATQGGAQQERRRSSGLQRLAPLAGLSPFGLALSPFAFVRRMMEDMDRMFEDFGGGGRATRGRTSGVGLQATEPDVQRGGLMPVWSPAIEVLERDGRLVVRADLPGLEADDVRVEVRDDALVIEGERKSEVEVEEEGGIYRSERVYGRFARVIPLPEGVDVDNAQATFENGVLEVSLPLPRESSRRRRIDIRGGSESGRPEQSTGPVH